MDGTEDASGSWSRWPGGDASGAFQPVAGDVARFDLSSESTFVWHVEAGAIDIEATARAMLRARSAHSGERLARTKLAIVALLLVVVLGLAGGFSSSLLVTTAICVGMVFGVFALARRRMVQLTARNLESGIYTGPHTHRMGPTGLYSSNGTSWSSSQAWRHMSWASLDGEVIVIQARAGGVHVLPARGLVAGPSSDEVVRQIQAWIDAADPARAAPG